MSSEQIVLVLGVTKYKTIESRNSFPTILKKVLSHGVDAIYKNGIFVSLQGAVI